MVVDDDQLRCGLGPRLEVAESRQGTGIEREQNRRFGLDEVGRREEFEAGQVAVVRRDDEGTGERGGGLDAGRAEYMVEREHRTQRVAIGIHMARERDPRRARDHASSNRKGLVDRPPRAAMEVRHAAQVIVVRV